MASALDEKNLVAAFKGRDDIQQAIRMAACKSTCSSPNKEDVCVYKLCTDSNAN